MYLIFISIIAAHIAPTIRILWVFLLVIIFELINASITFCNNSVSHIAAILNIPAPAASPLSF